MEGVPIRLHQLHIQFHETIPKLATHSGSWQTKHVIRHLFFYKLKISNHSILSRISPNLRGIVYCNAIKLGSQAEWEFAWQRYLNTDVGSEKELLMSALGCSNEPWILIRYLEWAITEGSGIRKQDSVRVFSAVSSTVTGQRISYSFLQENWDEIKK